MTRFWPMKITCFCPSMMLDRRSRTSNDRSLASAASLAVLNLVRASASSVVLQFSHSLSLRAQLHSRRMASSHRRRWLPVTSANDSARLMLLLERYLVAPPPTILMSAFLMATRSAVKSTVSRRGATRRPPGRWGPASGRTGRPPPWRRGPRHASCCRSRPPARTSGRAATWCSSFGPHHHAVFPAEDWEPGCGQARWRTDRSASGAPPS